jgi:ATP-dependent Lhr-like helicase
MQSSLANFHPVLRTWFEDTFGSPTPPQALGWPKIDRGENVLLLAPTGSGKTLAAFFKCLDFLYRKLLSGEIQEHGGVQVLYISPLKALNNDIYKNLQQPLNGIVEAGNTMGLFMPQITTAVRTGDTPQSERQRMRRKPPHILITTPESLFLMLSSQAREILTSVKFVIVDEIHTLFPTKRGCHLALSLERLQNLAGQRPFQRIGLSATVNPLKEVGQFLVGCGRQCTIVNAGGRKDYDLQIELPLPDLTLLPEKSVWPPLYKKLYALIKEHKTTLVFVNNRRQAERIAVNLNQLAGEEIARTHHGSIAREMRLESEDLLKAGKIPCMVATSSLELGIDVGHIDLVVQIESPKEVARGIQRVGRAGHVVGLPSKARIIPKTRLDLLESLVMLSAVKESAIEPCHAPQNALDVLAQQLVAMTTEGKWSSWSMYAVCKGAHNYAQLKWEDFERTLTMLAGVYQSDQAIDLRPRLYWDRLDDVVSMDSYGKRLVYSNGGTIPNRGYYGVYLGEGGPRLGELDEEFVYERRLGDRFLLGTAAWRIEELRQDRVIVSKARGQGPNIPFWKGETLGRSYAFGERLGAFLAEAESHLRSFHEFHTWLNQRMQVEDQEISQNLFRLLQRQKASTGRLPSNTVLVSEEFLDEMGDWHICLHSPYGTKLHTLLALRMKEQVQSRTGIQVEAVPEDNGILFHAPGSQKPPILDWAALLTPDLGDRIAELISPTSLFGITFRHIAQRSLVMALAAYGKKRTPLWLSRLKATDLLQVVGKLPNFPLVMETYREILQDYFSVGDLEDFLTNLIQGKISIHAVRTQTPSPFARGHLFSFVGTQMYGDGAPVANDKKLFGMEADALQEVLGERLFALLREDAVSAVEARLQGRDALVYRPTLERAQYWLERMGDITWDEVESYFPDNHGPIRELLEELLRGGKLVEVGGLLVASLHREEYGPSRAQALRSILLRYARCHGPFSLAQLAQRYEVEPEDLTRHLLQLKEEGLLSQGAEDSWCSPQVLRDIRTLALNKDRHEVKTLDAATFSIFLGSWQGIHGEGPGLHGVLDQLRELWLPLARLETHILPARMGAGLKGAYAPAQLDQLLGSGLLSWRAKLVGREVFLRFESGLPQDATVLPSWVNCPHYAEDFLADAQLSPAEKTILDMLQKQGALNLIQLGQALEQGLSSLWVHLSALFLKGLISNDTLGPLRLLMKVDKNPQKSLRSLIESSVLGQMGRFFLLPPRRDVTALGKVEMLLDRYGVVTREMAVAEALSWGDLYPILDYLENIGEVKRGYFVDGLSGIQFARAQTVPILQQTLFDPGLWWVLPKEDPAHPGRFFNLEKAGAFTVFRGGQPVITAEKRQLSLEILAALTEEELEHGLLLLMRSLYFVYPDQKITVGQINQVPVAKCPELNALKRLGFELGYKEIVLWPSQRK